MKEHYHAKITPEIRRELFGAEAWKKERLELAAAAAAASASTGNASALEMQVE